jgi:1-deoxyxylulose-5-phosphate synthase
MAEIGEEITRGRARFRGISSHHPHVLIAALESGLCDVLLFPVGPFCDPRYVEEILPLARSRGVGTVCFKTFGAPAVASRRDRVSPDLVVGFLVMI